MADIGFGGHEGHRHLVADLAAAQFGVEDEEEFIGRAEAGRALHRADDDRAGVLAEGLERHIGLKRVIDMADRLRMPAMRPQPLDLVKGQFRPGRDDEVVVVEKGPVDQLKPVFRRMNLLRRRGAECDVLLAHRVGEVDGDVFGLAPADRDPGVGGDEVIRRFLGDDRDPVFLPDLLAQLIGHDGATQPRAQDNDMRHRIGPPAMRLSSVRNGIHIASFEYVNDIDQRRIDAGLPFWRRGTRKGPARGRGLRG